MARGVLPGRITERDQEIFQFLFENKIATPRQLAARFFPGVSQATAYRRFKQLDRAGWLNRMGRATSSRIWLAYGLSDRAYRRCIKLEGVNDRRDQYSSDKPGHDLTLVDLRIRLESRRTVKRVYPENLLQAMHEFANTSNFRDSIALHSDAVLELVPTEGARYFVPFEFEGSAKATERWQRKLLDYYLKHDSEVVLWVCQDATMIRRMAAIDQEVNPGYSPKMYFASLEEVQSGQDELTFVNSKRDKRIVI